MKKIVKGMLVFIAGLILMLIVFILIFTYQTKYKLTDIKEYTSPDKEHAVLVQMKGEPDWPFGAATARVKVTSHKRTIKEFTAQVYDDGASLSESNCYVEWKKDAVKITLMGSEQPDDTHVVSLLDQ